MQRWRRRSEKGSGIHYRIEKPSNATAMDSLARSKMRERKNLIVVAEEKRRQEERETDI